MKNVILATLGMGLLAMGLNANAGPGDMNFNIAVPQNCIADMSTGVATGESNMTWTAANGFVYNASVLDAATGGVNAAGATMTIANSTCNYAAKFSVKSTKGRVESGLDSAATSGFANGIDYTADATFCGKTASITANSSGMKVDEKTCAGASTSDFVVTVASAADSTPLEAGSYSDTVVVKLGPLW